MVRLYVDVSEQLTLEHTPDGSRLVVSRAIDATPETVWGLFVETSRWPEWGPSVSEVECQDRRISTGSTGRIKTIAGVWVPFLTSSRP